MSTQQYNCVDVGSRKDNTTKDGTVNAIGIRSNASDGAMPAMQAACQAFDARLLDNQTGDFADFGPDTASCMREVAGFRESGF